MLNIAGAGDDAGDDSRARMGSPRRRTVLRQAQGRHRGWAGKRAGWSGPPPRRASAETKDTAEVTASAYRKQGGAARAAEAPRPRTGRPRTRTSPPTLRRRRLPAPRDGAFAGEAAGRIERQPRRRDGGRGGRDGRGARGGRGSSAVEVAARGGTGRDDEAARPELGEPDAESLIPAGERWDKKRRIAPERARGEPRVR